MVFLCHSMRSQQMNIQSSSSSSSSGKRGDIWYYNIVTPCKGANIWWYNILTPEKGLIFYGIIFSPHGRSKCLILWPARGAGGSCYVFCPSLRQRWSTLLVLLFFHVNLLCMYKRFEIINHLHSHGWHNLLSWSPQHNWAQIYVHPLTFTRLTNQI